ncbi:Flp pilus assembly protein TadB [Pseudomonas chlororaphis subsp. aurantiaca]|uniref:Type II secretion system F family protein n=1 Tax=Pseudomonas chlororaphis subsp. aurantiaca TaxID=86192 RepID=A0AAJ1E1S7_9PSED|nr:type II secretion system F family protein [Pseudomonas chlororaphis]AZD37657.1 Flp pilus assembly protein TadB [Pseudomonas chlororaphis subsp. aurantiaca]AZD43996.1 Flp pilus assembly protein TadB [Pseudomonas chlororaphis subsp. aurantiaca]AZD50247.1 Flp pilus assembly protein TadB [Pseudomonas chlororaphis subsp. aurantiaca]AZD68908.1 Flp pilus assembly protein TadB [Pseudomonas chlororaphis subsp. aurantiaca]AZD75114.1 Flp pilus assembly protein TadB [Pseudomonas chlororaphis subsp. aur
MHQIPSEFILAFLGMVFTAIFLLSQSVAVPVFGEAGKVRKRIRSRLDLLERASNLENMQSVLRQKYLRRLSPLEARLEQLPAMEALAQMIEQAGHEYRAYRVLLLSLVLMLTAGMLLWLFTQLWWAALSAAAVAFWLPVLKISQDRNKRFALFEEQLPDALDAMCRALRAGHPFNETLQLVADEHKGPVAHEFGLTFADINYGNDVRRAMLGLLERMPSMTVMMLVTTVLIHRETGGNLTEVLDRLSSLIRGRFRFQRKVKTLSAEGRMSGWILVAMPFVLAAGIVLSSPTYLPLLINEPLGQKMVLGAFVAMLLGIFWIRKIIRIQV